MLINFTKYHGAGNDFILIDNRDLSFQYTEELVLELCHRRFGIAADGLMLLESEAKYDFKMRYFNSDGKESSMCGNGGRCIVAFAKNLGLIENKAHFIAVDGEHFAKIDENMEVELEMQDVKSYTENAESIFLNTGSPHVVRFIESHEGFNTYTEGYKIRYSDAYKKEGTNVNFVSFINDNEIRVSTYERGVEDETYSCGTGCVASSIASTIKNKSSINRYKIHTKGGILEVSFTKEGKEFTRIILKGPTAKVFTGQYEINK